MIISILGIIMLQGYWIFSAWNDKEEEFSLAVQQSLIRVAEEIQERELTDYINAYEKLIDLGLDINVKKQMKELTLPEQRIVEIAKMLEGSSISESAINHAKRLMN